ncbi:MAG: Coenzyme F420 hydrogenase/dehydrogenase, beta subunit C-terminal domain [Oscillospiraceae bacterium]|nr:Coenzyme F420 hydrogenase/dehydrogenase, beta subunit C-terminal domain [Oscillospiraceae bacterium]
MVICEKEKCTGCMSCVNICPRGCISMVSDNRNILHPSVDTDKCVNCQKCVGVCPANKPTEEIANEPLEAYAACEKDLSSRKTSSSGGIAASFYRKVQSMGGICYGAAFDSDLKLTVHSACNEEQISEFKGSKYTQAYIGGAYKEIRKNLQDCKQVIFIGTPCQVAGLKTFLGNNENDKLITVDLICHGVPSQHYLREHCDHIAKTKKINKDDISKITFRGENDWFLSLYDKNSKLLYSCNRFEDTYFLGFLRGLFYRESCYSCKYACSKRVSDITIGDFWGLGESQVFDRADRGKGVSAVLVNSEKGKEFFSSVCDVLRYEQREVSEAVAGNAQLKHPAPRNEKYDQFYQSYETQGFEESARQCLIQEINENIKKRRKNNFKNFFRIYKNKVISKIKRCVKG